MLNFQPILQPYKHILDSSELPEYIYDTIYASASQGDGLVEYCDGDFKVAYSWEMFKNEFEDFYEDEDDPECAKELKDFLDSFPEPYKGTDIPFLISFYQ